MSEYFSVSAFHCCYCRRPLPKLSFRQFLEHLSFGGVDELGLFPLGEAPSHAVPRRVPVGVPLRAGAGEGPLRVGAHLLAGRRRVPLRRRPPLRALVHVLAGRLLAGVDPEPLAAVAGVAGRAGGAPAELIAGA